MTISRPLLINAGGFGCSSTGLGGAKFRVLAYWPNEWKLNAISTTEASLTVPIEGFDISEEGVKCETWVGKGPTEPIIGAWTNGFNLEPLAHASTLTFSKKV